jgi:hypothetical protein
LQIWYCGKAGKDLMWANQDTGAAEVVGAQIQVEQLSKKAKVAWKRAEVV